MNLDACRSCGDPEYVPRTGLCIRCMQADDPNRKRIRRKPLYKKRPIRIPKPAGPAPHKPLRLAEGEEELQLPFGEDE